MSMIRVASVFLAASIAVVAPMRAGATVSPEPSQPRAMMEGYQQRHQQMLSDLDAALRTLEQARASNDPKRLRAAIDSSRAALGRVRTQVQASQDMMGMMGDRQGGMMGMMGERPNGMMPRGMMGGGGGASETPEALRRRLEATCGRPIDPVTAPQAAYRGQIYYFCSEADKRRFERSPEGFMRTRPR